MTACSERDSLPSAPSSPAAGIVLFDRANFAGVSAYIQNDVGDLSKYDGPCDHDTSDDVTVSSWDDCISSIRVSPGSRAVVYVNANFKGWAVTIDQDVPNLGLVLGPCSKVSIDNCITSIRVMSR